MAEPAPTSPSVTPPEPLRVLGLFDATAVVIGAIVGVGIFFTPSKMAALTGSGPMLLLAWAVAGVIALCGALTFAELGRRYTASGAQYQIIRDAWGPLPAFLFVFCNATAIQAGAIGTIAVVCTQYLAVAAGRELPLGFPLLAASVGTIAVLTLANIVGVRWGSRIQNLTVVSKLLTLALVVALAAILGTADVAAAIPPAAGSVRPAAWTGVLAALVPAFFAFGGWQQALWISGEVRDPRRNLPRAILVGVLIVIAVYLLANWAYLRLLGVAQVATSTTLAADAVGAVWPTGGRRLIAAAVGVSAFGVLNAQLLAGPRLLFGMARDGRFFAPFGRLHRTFGTPVAAILLLSAMGSGLLLAAGADGVGKMLTWSVFVDGIFFVLTAAAVYRLGRPDPAQRLLPIPVWIIAPAVFIVGEIGVLTGSFIDPSARDAAWLGILWIAAAALLFLFRFRHADPR